MAKRTARFHVKLEGYEKVWRRAYSYEKAIPLALAAALHAEAKRIMNKSKQEYVPIRQDYGALLASAYVEKPIFYGPIVEVELGYGGTQEVQYAKYIHEHPRSGKTGGTDPQGTPYPPRSWATTGQWKYLETPANDMSRTSAERIGADVHARLRAFSMIMR